MILQDMAHWKLNSIAQRCSEGWRMKASCFLGVPAEVRTWPLLFLSSTSGWFRRLGVQHNSWTGSMTVWKGEAFRRPGVLLQPILRFPLRLRLCRLCRLSGKILLARVLGEEVTQRLQRLLSLWKPFCKPDYSGAEQARKAIFSASLISMRFNQRWHSSHGLADHLRHCFHSVQSQVCCCVQLFQSLLVYLARLIHTAEKLGLKQLENSHCMQRWPSLVGCCISPIGECRGGPAGRKCRA